MAYKVIVQTKTGQTVHGKTSIDRDEAEGWEYMMTTTVEGERFKDVDIAILVTGDGAIYIPTDQIAAVQILEI